MANESTTCIPYGIYCYELISVSKERVKTNVCPYWHRDPTKPEQMNGYCSYMDISDWEGDGFGLLWDMVKECGINEEWDDEE